MAEGRRESRKPVPARLVLRKYGERPRVSHRRSLADAALIKDNHVIAAGEVVQTFRAAHKAFPEVAVHVVVTTAERARAVCGAGATQILLDNMTLDQMRTIVSERGDTVTFVRATGRLCPAHAASLPPGVDFVAVGAITQSAPILDIALDIRVA